LRGGFEHYRAFLQDAEHNKESAKNKLKMPVLALGGEYSLGTRVMDVMQAVAADVRGDVVDRCGHWIPDERPDYLLEQLLTFFSEDK
jgi:pimeloyl-ACP methyl ester carboxylesterase